MRRLVQRLAGILHIGASSSSISMYLPTRTALSAGMAQMGERAFCTVFSLRIENGFFRRNDNLCFHACAGKYCKKMPPQASNFCAPAFGRILALLWNFESGKPHEVANIVMSRTAGLAQESSKHITFMGLSCSG